MPLAVIRVHLISRDIYVQMLILKNVNWVEVGGGKRTKMYYTFTSHISLQKQ